ncbi:MAG: DNA repair protein RecO [Bacteroidetes bacterium]|nr:DNA repair protein RecO [Bacteroidota bacterium]
MKQKTLGILITKKNYSESSLILSFYTEDSGLISFIFKGAKKKKLPIFYLGIYEITYIKRPESNLGIVNSLDPAVILNDIFTNPQKLILSFFLADVLKETLKVEHADPRIFDFIKNQIIQLEIQENLIHFPIIFLTKHIQNLGFSPNIDSENPSGFDLKLGRFTKEKTDLETDAVDLLFSAFKHQPPIDSDKNTAQKALLILLDYCHIHLPNFNVEKSLKVIRETLYV